MINPGFIVADGMSCFACTIDLRYVNVKRDGGKMIFLWDNLHKSGMVGTYKCMPNYNSP